MKRLVLPLLSSLALGACAVEAEPELDSTTEAATVTVWHSVFNGTSADTSFSNEFNGAYLSVWQGKSGNTSTTSLSYSKWEIDPTSLECFTECFPNDDGTCTPWEWCYYTRSSHEYGWGEIPNADFTGNANSAKLDTVVAAGPTFYVERCEIDPISGWTCGAGAGGEIHALWGKDGYASGHQSGTNSQTYGRYSFRSVGTYRWFSATVSGALLGIDFAGSGGISNSRGSNVSKDVTL